jgi:hypothetical protein
MQFLNKLSAIIAILAVTLIVLPARAQRPPDVVAQKAAMKRLSFLSGKWIGTASISLGERGEIKIQQTEEVTYKLDGLILQIEGTGRDESGKIVFNALAIVSYDQGRQSYRIHAWNSGNFVESELRVVEKGFEWGFEQGPVTFRNQMKIDLEGRWSESSETVMKDGRKLHSVHMVLAHQ